MQDPHDENPDRLDRSDRAAFAPTPEVERHAALVLALTEELGPVRLRLLVERFGSAQGVLAAPPREARDVAGRPVQPTVAAFAEAQTLLATCRALDLTVLALSEPAYPEALRAIHDPPPVLFVRGTLPRQVQAAWEDVRALAVVGTRDASSRGRRLAYEIGRDLAAAGVVVVSGLALGIDGSAHEGALAVPGAPPVAIVAGGLDRVRPAVHSDLAQRIVSAGGAIASEDPPGARAYGHRFVARNRIVSGMSRGVVVVEAGARSGALHTADFALEQGRAVFAVPDHPTAGRAQGTLRLLRDGAGMLTRAADALGQLGWEGGIEAPPELPSRDLDLLVALADRAPCAAESLPGDPLRNMVALGQLEIEGLVHRDGTGRYRPTADARRAMERLAPERFRG